MCGLVGFLGGQSSTGEMTALVGQMADTLRSRGPDDGGAWVDGDTAIALGHRRLSIVDLSPAGHQPMVSASGRFVIAFNGEIYNHLDLRAALDGHCGAWRGHSDTETLLAGIEHWGLDETLRRAIGMFAIALWDRESRTLSLIRDRLGEKPLYFGWQTGKGGRIFLFGSELKALRRHPAFAANVDRDALALLLKWNYVPAPHSIYQGIAKLEPGCVLSVSLRDQEPKIRRYWDIFDVACRGASDPFRGTPEEAVDALDTLLLSATRQQMVADVPLGAFLSGGTDSSAIVALMQEQSSSPVKTFTIGFDEASHDEAPYAAAVARHLGTTHTELYVTPADALGVIPQLPDLYCEPFADSSQIPTYLVSKLARQHVTVSLSGDAGDELFCGYDRYPLTAALWARIRTVPQPLRSALAAIVQALPRRRSACTSRFSALYGRAGKLSCRNVDALYEQVTAHFPDVADWVVDSARKSVSGEARLHSAGALEGMERMMALDTASYLPDDILVKVDRAAMGVSLETRVPMLDHRVVEFAWSLPLSIRNRGGTGKWPLKEVLYRRVPRSLMERPKKGFSVPLDRWLRGPLRDWAETLLSEDRLRREGFLQSEEVRRLWKDHLDGRGNHKARLWNILMFQSWLEKAGLDAVNGRHL